MVFKDPGISSLHDIFTVVCDLLDKGLKIWLFYVLISNINFAICKGYAMLLSCNVQKYNFFIAKYKKMLHLLLLYARRCKVYYCKMQEDACFLSCDMQYSLLGWSHQLNHLISVINWLNHFDITISEVFKSRTFFRNQSFLICMTFPVICYFPDKDISL